MSIFRENFLLEAKFKTTDISKGEIIDYTLGRIGDCKISGTKGEKIPAERLNKDTKIINTNLEKILTAVAKDTYNYGKDSGYDKYKNVKEVKENLKIKKVRYSYNEKNDISTFIMFIDLKNPYDEHAPSTIVNITKNGKMVIEPTVFDG